MSNEQLLEIAINAFWGSEGNTRDGLEAVVEALKEALTEQPKEVETCAP